MFHLHEWSKWEIKEQKDLVDDKSDLIGTVLYQKRTCSSCGLTQLKRTMYK